VSLRNANEHAVLIQWDLLFSDSPGHGTTPWLHSPSALFSMEPKYWIILILIAGVKLSEAMFIVRNCK
jgi:hypothetical protein